MEVVLTHASIELLRERFNYDPTTGRITLKKTTRPNLRPNGSEAGCRDGHGYRRVGIFGKPYGGHVIAWAMHYGEWPAQWIDHRNGIKDDNRIANLRLATPSQNQANRRSLIGRSVKGVCWNKKSKAWQAAISIRGVTTYLGVYPTVEEAASTYARAAVKVYGEFARAG